MLHPTPLTKFLNFFRRILTLQLFKTIKLNKQYWNNKIPFLKYGTPNPLNALLNNKEKFSEAMTTFSFLGVFKTTQAGRHKETQLFLKTYLKKTSETVTILDIGASDGSTSLDLINDLQSILKKYYVTDYNIKCTYYTYKNYTYFFDHRQTCFLVASKKFVFYPINKKLFDYLFKKNLMKINSLPKTELLLINQELKEKHHSKDFIDILQYDIFEPWIKEKADITIVGNLLNRAYFSDMQIETALKNCYEALNENGLLAIIRNVLTDNGNEIEKSTIYKKNNTDKIFDKIHEINTGVEIDDFVLSLKF